MALLARLLWRARRAPLAALGGVGGAPRAARGLFARAALGCGLLREERRARLAARRALGEQPHDGGAAFKVAAAGVAVALLLAMGSGSPREARCHGLSSAAPAAPAELAEASAEASAAASAEGDSKPKRPKWVFEEVPRDISGIFLDAASRERLLLRFPPRFATRSYDHVTVTFEPKLDEVLEQDDLLGEETVVYVLGYAEDDTAQTVLVEIASPHIKSQNKFAHITLSHDPARPAKYSGTLLHRIAAEGGRRVFRLPLGPEDKSPGVWEGALPEAGIYAATRARFENVERERLELTGTYCLRSKFEQGERTCSYVKENPCSFCKFMKGGPCRVEFSGWEKCVAASKELDKNDNDFIDRCAALTMALKGCVDAHPEYYDILSGDDKKSSADEAKEPEDAPAGAGAGAGASEGEGEGKRTP